MKNVHWSVWIKYVRISFHFKFKEFLQLVNHSSIFSWNLMKLHSRWRVKLCTYVSYFFLPVYFFKLFQPYLNNIVPLKLHSCKVQMSGIVCNKNTYDTFLEQPSSGTPNVKIFLKPKNSQVFGIKKTKALKTGYPKSSPMPEGGEHVKLPSFKATDSIWEITCFLSHLTYQYNVILLDLIFSE